MSDNIIQLQQPPANGKLRKDTVQTELPRITPSSIGDLECALKFYTLRILKQWPSREPLDSVAHGTAVHQVLRQVYERRSQGKPDLSNLEAFAKGAVYNGRFSKDHDRQAGVAHVIRAVIGFVDNDDEEDVIGTLALERQVEFAVRHDGEALYMLSAKLDRILVRPSAPTQLIVRDYKTGKPRINLQEAFVMLWAAKSAFPSYESYVLELDYQDEDYRIERHVVTSDDVRGQYQILTQAARRVLTATEYPAEPGEVCTYCPLRTSCQRLPDAEMHSGEDVF